MNYVLKSDNPDFAYNFDIGEVTDAQGDPLPDASIDVTVKSSNPGVLTVTENKGRKSGKIQVGSPGRAEISYEARKRGETTGDPLAAGADSFIVTSGDPEAVSSIEVEYEGVEPVDSGARPDQGLPGSQPKPDQGLPGSQPGVDNTLPGGRPERPDNALPGDQPGVDNTLPGGKPARPDQGLPPSAQPKKK